MTSKQVTLPKAPKVDQSKAVDAFVKTPVQPVNPGPAKKSKEPLKRLALEIPTSLHKFIKLRAVEGEGKMRDELMSILLNYYGELGYQPPEDQH